MVAFRVSGFLSIPYPAVPHNRSRSNAWPSAQGVSSLLPLTLVLRPIVGAKVSSGSEWMAVVGPFL
ncbi:hypothetical protein RBWH47_02441 [Rhodopirellula baltica WH47]|uniref:Uncharacterized protein n=1 Tax=Rhodopirellula baltica WH47 TaxID=991778 RepID=F2AXS6_RHOBT|nr:hypothetical protein RBWH47_02441 [Rhodopirellula baltica WH47]